MRQRLWLSRAPVRLSLTASTRPRRRPRLLRSGLGSPAVLVDPVLHDFTPDPGLAPRPG